MECYHGLVRIVLPAALLLASCASPEAAPFRPLRDFRGIIHCHSKYSHDSKGTYEEILAAARAAKVDFICITDHPPKGDRGLSLREGWTGLHDGVLFIQGHELAGVNLLGIGLREPVEGDTPDGKIRHVHAQGGVAIVSHPEEVKDWEPYLGADGMEVYNVHAALKGKQKEPGFIPAALKRLREAPDRVFDLLRDLDPAVIAKWDEINRTRPFTGIAGNDSHQNVNFMGVQLDPYERAFRFVSTHVLAEELTEAAVLRALREGRAYVRFDSACPDGVRAVFSKDADGASVDFESPALPEYHDFQLFRDGQILPKLPHDGLRYVIAQPGVYRATYGLPGSGSAPLYLSNPFRYRP